MKTTSQRQQECARKIGKRVRLLRKSRDLTQVELAELAEVNSNYLGQVERGEITISVAKLLRIADALDVSLGTLVDPCWVAPIASIDEIKKELQKKIESLQDLDVLVLDRMADYLRAKADQKTIKEEPTGLLDE